MVRKVLTKTAAIMLAATVAAGIAGPLPISAKQPSSKQAARYIQPDCWNQEELKAYQFDSMREIDNLEDTGITHYYKADFKPKDGFVKVTIVDPGVFVVDGWDDYISLYDKNKKKISSQVKELEGYRELSADYYVRANAGDVFYIKFSKEKFEKLLTIGVIKDSFSAMKKDDICFQSGTGNVTYHPFTVKKRAEIDTEIIANDKEKGSIQTTLEQYVNGKWIKIGNAEQIKAGKDKFFIYGLAKGKYRFVLNVPQGQMAVVYYDQDKWSKNVAYTKSKAKVIKNYDQVDNIYTQNETAARWYKIKVGSNKEKNKIKFSKYTSFGEYQFKLYKQGKKKAMKTIKLTTNYDKADKTITLPKKRGTYYIKISKLTKKTNGVYFINRN